MALKMQKVGGRDAGKIVLYALSTCGWCRKTKQLLGELGVQYEYVDVDLLDGDGRTEVLKEVERWNPSLGFPTLVFNHKKCISGYDEAGIRKAVGA